jgi:2-methylisocitrate lyase-like PEP mutase family enzyme
VEDDKSISALDRIDRAIARIEAVVTGQAEADAVLSRRHEALRSRVTQAIAALDTLIDQGSDG